MSYTCITHGWHHILNPCPTCGNKNYIQAADTIHTFRYEDQREKIINGLEHRLKLANTIIGVLEDKLMTAEAEIGRLKDKLARKRGKRRGKK